MSSRKVTRRKLLLLKCTDSFHLKKVWCHFNVITKLLSCRVLWAKRICIHRVGVGSDVKFPYSRQTLKKTVSSCYNINPIWRQQKQTMEYMNLLIRFTSCDVNPRSVNLHVLEEKSEKFKNNDKMKSWLKSHWQPFSYFKMLNGISLVRAICCDSIRYSRAKVTLVSEVWANQNKRAFRPLGWAFLSWHVYSGNHILFGIVVNCM